MNKLKAFIVFSSKTHCSYINKILERIEKKFEEMMIESSTLGDEIRSTENYLTKLTELIDKSDFGVIITDGFRPNVLFEYGFLFGRKKPIMLFQDYHAEINIKTLYRDFRGHNLWQCIFQKILKNPKLETGFVFSDIQGLHIEYYDKNAEKEDKESIENKFTDEFNKAIERKEIFRELSLEKVKASLSSDQEKYLQLLIDLSWFDFIELRGENWKDILRITKIQDKELLLKINELEKIGVFKRSFDRRIWTSPKLVRELFSHARKTRLFDPPDGKMLSDISKSSIASQINNLSQEKWRLKEYFDEILKECFSEIDLDNSELWGVVLEYSYAYQSVEIILNVLDHFEKNSKKCEETIQEFDKKYHYKSKDANLLEEIFAFLFVQSFNSAFFKKCVERIYLNVVQEGKIKSQYLFNFLLHFCRPWQMGTTDFKDRTEFIVLIPESYLEVKIKMYSAFCFSLQRSAESPKIRYNLIKDENEYVGLHMTQKKWDELSRDIIESHFFGNYWDESKALIAEILCENFIRFCNLFPEEKLLNWLKKFHTLNTELKFKILKKYHQTIRHKWHKFTSEAVKNEWIDSVESFVSSENMEFQFFYYLSLEELSYYSKDEAEYREKIHKGLKKVGKMIPNNVESFLHIISTYFDYNENMVTFCKILIGEYGSMGLYSMLQDHLVVIPPKKIPLFFSVFYNLTCEKDVSQANFLLKEIIKLPFIQNNLNGFLRLQDNIDNNYLDLLESVRTDKKVKDKDILSALSFKKSFSGASDRLNRIILSILKNIDLNRQSINDFYKIYFKLDLDYYLFQEDMIKMAAFLDQYHYTDWQKTYDLLRQMNLENSTKIFSLMLSNSIELDEFIESVDWDRIRDISYNIYNDDPTEFVTALKESFKEEGFLPGKFLLFVGFRLLEQFPRDHLKQLWDIDANKLISCITQLYQNHLINHAKLPSPIKYLLHFSDDISHYHQEIIQGLFQNSFSYFSTEEYIKIYRNHFEKWLEEENLTDLEKKWINLFIKKFIDDLESQKGIFDE